MYAYVAKSGPAEFPAHSELDLDVTVDETVTVGEALAAAANVVAGAVNTAALNGYTMRVTASIGAVVIQLRMDPEDEWADYLDYVVTNYDGAFCGFADDLYLDLAEEDAGETVTVHVEVLNVEPDGWPAGWAFPGPPWPPGWSEETKAEEVAGQDTSSVLAAGCRVPESLPPGLPDCWRIKAYTDGMLVSCAECADWIADVWNGTFTYVLPPSWYAFAPNHAPIIDGKLLATGRIWLQTGPPGVCMWKMYIKCSNYPQSDMIPIWVGNKVTGDTPAGIYTRESGCSSVSALEIEECPA